MLRQKDMGKIVYYILHTTCLSFGAFFHVKLPFDH